MLIYISSNSLCAQTKHLVRSPHLKFNAGSKYTLLTEECLLHFKSVIHFVTFSCMFSPCVHSLSRWHSSPRKRRERWRQSRRSWPTPQRSYSRYSGERRRCSHLEPWCKCTCPGTWCHVRQMSGSVDLRSIYNSTPLEEITWGHLYRHGGYITC